MYLNHFDGLVQERHNSIANVLELRLSWANPLIYAMELFLFAQIYQFLQPVYCESIGIISWYM